MRVLALTKYGPLGASSRVRTLQFQAALRDEGIFLEPQPLLSDSYLRGLYAGRVPWGEVARAYARRTIDLLATGGFDAVWIEKEALPWVPTPVERLLTPQTIPVILDYDDAVFHNYDRHRRWVVRRTLGRKLDRLMSHAAAVCVGNEYLAARARRAGARRVVHVPSVLDLARYGPPLPEAESGPFTIGWIGSPGSERFLDYARDALEVLTREDGVRLLLVGATGRALAGLGVERQPWSLASEVEQMRRFSVGIMPLADTDFQRGKCGYKLLQCMAVGRPVVASPVGVNAEIVEDGANGYLAADSAGWLEALRRLRADRETRLAMGAAGRRKVESRYTIEAVLPTLVELFRTLGRSAG